MFNNLSNSVNGLALIPFVHEDQLAWFIFDLFATDTTDFADIVLPAASFLEFDDVVISYFNQSISAQVRSRTSGRFNASSSIRRPSSARSLP